MIKIPFPTCDRENDIVDRRGVAVVESMLVLLPMFRVVWFKKENYSYYGDVVLHLLVAEKDKMRRDVVARSVVA